MNKKERINLAKWAMNRASKAGADQVAVNLSNRRDIDIEVRDKKLDILKEANQNSLGLTIYTDHKYSSHSTNDLNKVNMEKFIDEAVASTKYLAQDPYRELIDPKYYPKSMDQDLGILDPKYDKIVSADRVKMAEKIEAVARSQSNQIISSTASYSDVHFESLKVHSNGFIGEREGTSFYCGVSVTIDDKQGGRPADGFGCTTRFHEDLPNPDMIGPKAVERALQRIGQKKIASGKYTMLVENRAASRLLFTLQGAMSGRNLQQKNSFLEGMLGKKIASEKLSLINDPFIIKGLGSRHYDNDGMAAQRRVMIDKGVLKHYFIGNYYGRKLEMEPTSGSYSNMVFEYGDKSFDELMKSIEKGIVVTRFIGGNSNNTTGDFSLGVIGLYVENGKVIHPVNEMNITGNGKTFWNQIVEMGNDPYVFSSYRRPSIMFADVDFSGL